MIIQEYLVQNGEPDDDCLHRPLLPVNMRLFRNNVEYRSVVLAAVAHLRTVAATRFDNYPKLQGISGANVGVPFNIVIVNDRVMLNPCIMWMSEKTRDVISNCGSLCLSSPVPVTRAKSIRVSFYTLNGSNMLIQFYGSEAATVQHEIEHNNGKLIT
jgi:peptide deformylase